LDPCDPTSADNLLPQEELLFDAKGKVASDTVRGRKTIDVLGLNRTQLVQMRADAYQFLLMEWKELLASLKDRNRNTKRQLLKHITRPSVPFLALRRQFVNQWCTELVSRQSTEKRVSELEALFKTALTFRTALTRKVLEGVPLKVTRRTTRRTIATARGQRRKAAPPPKETAEAAPTPKQLQSVLKKTVADYADYETQSETFSVAKERDKESYFGKRRLIERIEIKNFKIIENVSLHFPVETAEKGSWLLLLGENGTGKSSILQAVALALMGKKIRARLKLNASQYVRHGRKSGYVKVYLLGTHAPVELHFRKGSRQFRAVPEDPKVLLLGYGSTRLLPRDGARTTAAQTSQAASAKADNLFNPFVPLNDATPWLWALKDDEFDRIARALKDLMLLREKDRLVRNPRDKKRIEVDAFGTQVTLEDLSDGYQSVLALATDIMSVMRLRWPAMDIAEGIVLIDEIDAHLHPSWRMKIVQRLRAVFPRLQFLVTSHDPLTLRGLRAGEVIVMKANQRHRPVAITNLPSPEGMRVDQLLTSEYFGLNSTVDPATEEKFEEYYHLLALRTRTAAQEERLSKMKTEMESLELLGTTRREQMMLAAADEFLAQSSPRAADEPVLKEQTRRKLLGMWKKLA
ncbi:MAG TPA: AAA family ATPase, partial [Pyrinomonadaceae bacterium]|nr:AAA family ATPase [Pyrinomonadaceae bacterium]